VTLKSASTFTIGGGVLPNRSCIFSKQERTRGGEARLAKMSLFVACHVLQRAFHRYSFVNPKSEQESEA
jgi:hypothetical protein